MGKKNPKIAFEDENEDSSSEPPPPPPPSTPPPSELGCHEEGGVDQIPQAKQPSDEVQDIEITAMNTAPIIAAEGETSSPKTKSKGLSNKLYIGTVVCLLVCIIVIMAVGFGTGWFLESTPRNATDNQQIINENNNNALVEEESNSAIVEVDSGTETEANSINVTEAPVLSTGLLTKPPIESPAELPTEAPVLPILSPVVTLSPQEKEEMELEIYEYNMKEFLSSISFKGEATIYDPNTPESLAQQFLAFDDPLRLDSTNPDQQWRITQRYALMTLWYHSESMWIISDRWLLDRDECKWFGVQCNEVGEVNAISLENNNLNGEIPDDFFLLVSLKSINFAGNFLEGNIPLSLQMLTQLEEIYLDRNRLRGLLTEFDFTPLQSLQTIDVSFNEFRGPIPESIYDLQSLQYLVLDNNQFEGGISVSITKLSDTLQRLTLSNNQLTGNIVPELGQLLNLEVLWLFNNDFTGPLFTEEFLNMQSLTVLDVVMNEISGEIPTEFGDMPNLRYLNLGKNKFTGIIPSQLPANLQVLNVEDNDLSGRIPFEIQEYNITVLRLGNNGFTLRNNRAAPRFLFSIETLVDLRLNGIGYAGPLDDNVENLINLETLHLQDNAFEDAFPIRILNAIGASLTDLDISSNNFRGEIPDYIEELLPQIETLDFSNNNFGGNLPLGLTSLQNLSYLDASSNAFGGNFLQFGSAGGRKIKYLNLKMNNIAGTIPPSIENLIDLETFDISDNQITGTIPTQITALYKLEILSLSSNSMSGNIPEGIGDMENLQELRLHTNIVANDNAFGFSGTLPGPALAKLKKLRVLELYSNQFTGTLPEELGACINLQLIDLAFNPDIVGTIPPSFSSLIELEQFYIYETGISGIVPAEFCSNVSPEYFVTACSVTCDCCSSCA